jgi:hypothetical protein
MLLTGTQIAIAQISVQVVKHWILRGEDEDLETSDNDEITNDAPEKEKVKGDQVHLDQSK